MLDVALLAIYDAVTLVDESTEAYKYDTSRRSR